jgi:hypothetical protein
MNNTTKTGYIKLPSTYHEKAKLEYADWHQAWFREAIQNEMDAGANKIDFYIDIDPNDPEMVKVVCHGNGHGMDEDRLINSFLVMGGSQKSEGNIGGFGYAKVILAFAHSSYEIETQGLHVKGEGSDYSWSSGHMLKPGVRLTANMKKSDADVWRMEDSLNRLIHHSNFSKDMVITLNGDVLNGKSHEHPYSQETPIGKLTFKDQPHGMSSSVLWVRMRGLAMFQTRLYMNSSTAFEGYLELEGNSREMLTSNRDSLSGDHRDVLNQIMNQLATDREKLKLSGDIDLLLNEKAWGIGQMSALMREELETAAQSMSMSSEAMLDYLESVPDEITDGRAIHPFQSLLKKVTQAKDKMASKLDKIPSHWYPPNFKVKYLNEGGSPEDSHVHAGDISSRMNLKRYGKMAAGWQAIINKLLSCDNYRSALCVHRQSSGAFVHDDCHISSGFVFGSPEGLCSREDKQGRVTIMMNPRVADDENLCIGDLIDIANHELTHLEIDYHDEGFTMRESKLRRIMRKEIGERDLVQAFEGAIADWRDVHNDKKPTRSPAPKTPTSSTYEM